MIAAIAAATSAYDDATEAAERQYDRDVAVAAKRRAEALEDAREAFQAVLDADAPNGVKITITYTGPGSAEAGTP